MRLTICLVTKGRKEYLEEALNSYEKFVNTGDVDVIIIDNGSDNLSKEILYNWKLKYDSKVNYYRVESNEKVGTPFFWGKIKSFAPEWIIFPGDDDRLVFEVYKEWRNELESNPELKAFACSAQIIDHAGELLKQIRKPPLVGLIEDVETLTLAFHEAPFLWPGLFFKFDRIPEKVINSRYVFDWWVGLHLVLSGNFKVTESIGVEYRVHPSQESFQSPNRRKFFEGFNMLTSFIKSNEFEVWIQTLSDSDKLKFFSSIDKIKPIYSQEYFYLPIVKEISSVMIKNSRSELLNLEVAEIYLLSGGVFTKKNDLANLFTGLLDSPQRSPGNFAIICRPGTCKKLMQIETTFNKDSQNLIEIYCRHSKSKKGAIYISCKKIRDISEDEIADKIILEINLEYELRGSLKFTLTPKERYLITFIRALRPTLPAFIRSRLIVLNR